MFYIEFSDIVARDKKLFKEMYGLKLDKIQKNVKNKLYSDTNFLSKLKPRKEFVSFYDTISLSYLQGVKLVTDIELDIIESWLFKNGLERIEVLSKQYVIDNIKDYDKLLKFNPFIYEDLYDIVQKSMLKNQEELIREKEVNDLYAMCRIIFHKYNDDKFVEYLDSIQNVYPKDGVTYQDIEERYFLLEKSKGDYS